MLKQMKDKAQNQQAKNIELLVKRAPRLILNVIDGQALPKGFFVKINAFGVESRESVRMHYLSQNKLTPAVVASSSRGYDHKQIYQLDCTTFFGSYAPIPLQEEN